MSSLVSYSRLSGRGSTYAFDRKRIMVIEMIEQWMGTVDSHRGGIKAFDHWSVTVDRQR